MGYIEEDVVSTIFVGGLPPDAAPRELDNLCRFMPGYVNSKIDNRKGLTLFVQFDSSSTAQEAIARLNNQVFDRNSPGEPMRVVMAKSNMRTHDIVPRGQYGTQQSQPLWGMTPPIGHSSPYRGGGGGASSYGGSFVGSGAGTNHGGSAHQSWAFSEPSEAFGGQRGAKRSRLSENPNSVDTVACVGAAEAGFDEFSVQAFFTALPGFVAFKPNPRMGGGFAKFASPHLASEAVAAAESDGMPAAIAKSSMTALPHGHGQPPPPPAFGAAELQHEVARSKGGVYAAGACGGGQPPPPPTAYHGAGGKGQKPYRTPEDPTTVDTLACEGAREAGFDDVALQAFFMQLAGFLVFKPNPRMGGGFVKFSSPSQAAEALTAATEHGIPTAIAKSSMSDIR